MKEMLIKSNINRCHKETHPHVFHQVLVSLRLWGMNDPSTLYCSSTGHRDKRTKHTTVLLLMDELKGKPLFNHLSAVHLAPPTQHISSSSPVKFSFSSQPMCCLLLIPFITLPVALIQAPPVPITPSLSSSQHISVGALLCAREGHAATGSYLGM